MELECCTIADCTTTSDYLIDVDELIIKNSIVKNNDVSYALFNDEKSITFENITAENNSFASDYLLQCNENGIHFENNVIKGFN